MTFAPIPAKPEALMLDATPDPKGGAQRVNRLVVFLGDAVAIRTEFTPAQLEHALAEMDKAVCRLVLTRCDVIDQLAGGLRAGHHSDPSKRARLCLMVLWLLASESKAWADKMRAGGTAIACEVTPQPDPQPWHIGLSVDEVSAGTHAARPTEPAPRGQGAILDKAVAALCARDELPGGLSRKERDRRLAAELRTIGAKMPSRRTLDRLWAKHRRAN
jgi:hypothetical protein